MSLITTGEELSTFITSLNAEAAVDPTLLNTLVETGKAVLEEERDWMALRKINTSLSLSTSDTWQTSKSLAGITDFNRIIDDAPVTLFDGNNLTHEFIPAPFDRRLQYKDDSGTFVHDHNANALYFNGRVPFSGTLWLPYVANSPAIDLTSNSAVWTTFPSRVLPILGFYAIGVFKGAVDYDQINKLMLPHNAQALDALKQAMINWDDKKQLANLDPDPTGKPYFRSGAINRDA
jgi:hypothetical protein